jgi:hypothetical protein
LLNVKYQLRGRECIGGEDSRVIEEAIVIKTRLNRRDKENGLDKF